MDKCDEFYLSIRTNSVESKFGTRLYFVPKNKVFPKTFRQRIKLVDLHWDEKHISEYSIQKYGEGERQRRKQWKLRIHQRILQQFPQVHYVESRGRKKKHSESESEKKI